MILEAGCDATVLREEVNSFWWPYCLRGEEIKSQVLDYIMQPGSLKHLSRLAYRDKLKNNIKFKISLTKEIPDLIKDYITFKHFEQFISKPTIAASHNE